MTENPARTTIDAAALARKYEEEKQKRIKAHGRDYLRLEGKLAHFQADPYRRGIEREPVVREVEVAVLGSGWGGLLTAARLRDNGIDDIVIIDKAGDFGGVWYWNRYPGVACDTEAYVYMPLLEEMGVMPKGNFASGQEIYEHAQRIARHFGLYEKALFETAVNEARWDEAAGRWTITTDRGDTIRARFFVMTSGSLQIPKLPGIPGIESFQGHSFHTSRWDYAYTGGNSYGKLEKLADKRVAIIGTGATAVQCIPHLAEAAKHLTVVQRTPSAIGLRNEHPTDEAWYKGQEPGWQMRRIENFTSLTAGEPVDEDLVNDGWTEPVKINKAKIKPGMSAEQIRAIMQETDYEIGEQIRARVDAVVKDKKTAESLKPWYNRLCKRPCFHDGFLDVFNRPNVTLVDTQGESVERITERGLVVHGKEYEVDCIIYSTGFQLGPYADAPIIPVIGRDGLTLADKWSEGAQTLHGFHVHGFPNFFMVSITQSPWGANFMHMLLEQSTHLGHVIRELTARGVTREEVTAEAEAAWVAHHEELAAKVAGIWADCTPGFFNNEGNLNRRTLRSGSYGGGVLAFVQKLRQWREDGSFEGLELVRATAPV